MEKFEDRESVVLQNENQKIFGMLHKPINPEKSRFPAVFFCHGFAGNKCGRHRMYVILAEQLSKLGFTVFRMDFRGCGDSEGDLINTTIDSEISDALIGLHYLESLPFVDTSRIGIFGRSLGGAIAVLIANRYKKIKSLALWAPLFHAEQWKEEWKRAQKQIKENIPEDFVLRINGHVAGKKFVHQIFEMQMEKELASLQTIPLLHIHGEKDTIIHVEHADHYIRCRENAKDRTRFLRLPQGDHDFTLLDTRRHAINETCDWFKETLL